MLKQKYWRSRRFVEGAELRAVSSIKKVKGNTLFKRKRYGQTDKHGQAGEDKEFSVGNENIMFFHIFYALHCCHYRDNNFYFFKPLFLKQIHEATTHRNV